MFEKRGAARQRAAGPSFETALEGKMLASQRRRRCRRQCAALDADRLGNRHRRRRAPCGLHRRLRRFGGMDHRDALHLASLTGSGSAETQ